LFLFPLVFIVHLLCVLLFMMKSLKLWFFELVEVPGILGVVSLPE
jgi:hypothetical protein